MQDERRAQRTFLVLWGLATVIKVSIAARLPLFVDEAFYWQEGQHPALAYSDLPGLTAWMTWWGTAVGGQHVLALRAPFLLLAALLPWLITRIATRWFGAAAGWQAGSLTVLMPLAGTLGMLALPDVPMAFATVLCLDAGARLLRKVDAMSALQLAIGLALGALSHYRFVGVIGVGLIAIVLLPEGRRMLRDARIWVALAVGAAAWAPLLAWNLENAESGLRFQLLDRHPWHFHLEGLRFVLIQAALVTPLLFFALVRVFARAWGDGAGVPPQWRYFGLLGGVSTVGLFVLGFFADAERVSFHWPLPGYLALLVAVPLVLAGWARPWRVATWALAGLGLVATLAYYLAVSAPELRARLAATKHYPENFSGWNELAAEVRALQAQGPPDMRLLADNFKVAAELGFLLDDPDIPVLDHPLNHKHGRAAQLRLWGLWDEGARQVPTLLVLSPGDVPYRQLLARYHAVCERVGPLPPPKQVSVDHGSRRFLLFPLPAERAVGPCVAPALAWVDAPVAGARAGRQFEVTGWAFKEGTGLARVEVLLDGQVIAEAQYGLDSPGVADFWRISNDPNHPRVGFRATVDVPASLAGARWLGLRLHGADGSAEDWPEQPLHLAGPEG